MEYHYIKLDSSQREQIDLNLYQTRILSQWGQDGVLDKIFNTIGTTNKYFVEFGSSGTDSGMGNTAQLRRKGFDGLLMDGSEKPYGEDVNDRRYPVKIEFVKPSNINQLFKKYNVPTEFDLLSIDVDGQDFHIWNNLEGYSPRVVSIEMNYHIDPGFDKVGPCDDDWVWNGWFIYGASITALKKLGNKKGYSLVASCTSDAIFVRNDLIKNKFMNVNNEFELVRLNTTLKIENDKAADRAQKYHNVQYGQHLFDIPFFTTSDKFL
jgi:hypothetical protein